EHGGLRWAAAAGSFQPSRTPWRIPTAPTVNRFTQEQLRPSAGHDGAAGNRLPSAALLLAFAPLFLGHRAPITDSKKSHRALAGTPDLPPFASVPAGTTRSLSTAGCSSCSADAAGLAGSPDCCTIAARCRFASSVAVFSPKRWR